MLIIFGRNNHWVSKTIRWLTWGDWSHVAVIDGNQVIESVGPPISDWILHCLFNTKYKKPYGVQLNSLKGFGKRYTHHEIRFIEGDVSIARARIGMPFDMLGMFGYLINADWQDPTKDYCVETVVHAATHIENHVAHKISPAALYWFSQPVTE